MYRTLRIVTTFYVLPIPVYLAGDRQHDIWLATRRLAWHPFSFVIRGQVNDEKSPEDFIFFNALGD